MRRTLAVWATVLAIASGCAPRGPRAIAYDAESCDFCRMTISDPRFGAEAISATGKRHVFDSIECLASFVSAQRPSAIRAVWVSDWNRPGQFVSADSADFRRLQGALGSPMGKGYVATARGRVPNGIDRPGPVLRWSDVLAEARNDAVRDADRSAEAHAR